MPFASSLVLLQEELYFQPTCILQVPFVFCMGRSFCFTLAFCNSPRSFSRGILFTTYFPFVSTHCLFHGKIIWFTSSCLPFISILFLLHRKIYFYLRLPFVSVLFLSYEKNIMSPLLSFCKSPLPFSYEKLSHWLTFCKYFMPFAWEERYVSFSCLLQVSPAFCRGKITSSYTCLLQALSTLCTRKVLHCLLREG